MQWREANRRHQRHTIRYRGLVPNPPLTPTPLPLIPPPPVLSVGVLKTNVKVGLMQCFTAFLDRQRATGAPADHSAALREAQIEMGSAHATKTVAVMVPDPDAEVSSAAITFATSLFWGGNAAVQDALVGYLKMDRTLLFLRTLADKVRARGGRARGEGPPCSIQTLWSRDPKTLLRLKIEKNRKIHDIGHNIGGGGHFLPPPNPPPTILSCWLKKKRFQVWGGPARLGVRRLVWGGWGRLRGRGAGGEGPPARLGVQRLVWGGWGRPRGRGGGGVS